VAKSLKIVFDATVSTQEGTRERDRLALVFNPGESAGNVAELIHCYSLERGALDGSYKSEVSLLGDMHACTAGLGF